MTNYGYCICLKKISIKNAVTLIGCEHVFHEKCIKSWLNLFSICPLCRKDVYNSHVRKRYFDLSTFNDQSINKFFRENDELYEKSKKELSKLVDELEVIKLRMLQSSEKKEICEAVAASKRIKESIKSCSKTIHEVQDRIIGFLFILKIAKKLEAPDKKAKMPKSSQIWEICRLFLIYGLLLPLSCLYVGHLLF
uniref:RING-type domain-containing protein n=1 Tax=Panagrolaimus sp. JU765 TaxID=591449 RepID=A0AC34Q8I4_9BILA